MSKLPSVRRRSARTSSRIAALILGGISYATVAADFVVASGDVAGLGAAIVQANANTDCANRIVLSSGTWSLNEIWSGIDATANTGLPLIDLSRAPNCSIPGLGGRLLEIQGAGRETTIIERATSAPRLRFFAVTPGGFGGEFGATVGLALSDLTLRGGDLFPPTASDFCCNGGAITVDSSDLTLTRVALLNNRAVQGGAIEMQTGRLFITDSRLEGNTSARQGGAIYGSGVSRIERANVSNNTAGGLFVTDASQQGGGGILWRSDGLSTITESSIAGNRILSNLRSGGGLHILGRVHIVRSALIGNQATADGGGLHVDPLGGPVDIQDSSFSANFAPGRGAAISSPLANGGPEPILTLNQVTVASNEVIPGGAAIAAQVTMHGSLIAATRLRGATSGGSNCSNDTLVSSGGYNLDSDASCRLAGSNDFSSFNPSDVLDLTARDNGGLTLTHALVRTGLAVDRGDPSFCTLTDQRGVARVLDGNQDGIAGCDIGAFELAPPSDFPFTGFDAQVLLTRSANNSGVHASGSFSVSALSDGISLATESLVFTISDATGIVFSQTLPAGSLQTVGKRNFLFRAPSASGIHLARVSATARPGEFSFQVIGHKLDLPTRVATAVTVQLRIGNDLGSESLPCRGSTGITQCR